MNPARMKNLHVIHSAYEPSLKNILFRFSFLVVISSLVFTSVSSARTQTPKPQKSDGRYVYHENHDPDGIGKFYMGREIAQVMGHQAADWLDRPEREAEEAPSLLLKSLKLKPGQAIADIGAGSGYLTFPMAKRVGTKGTVYAVEIQQEMLDIIAHKQETMGLKNIKMVLGAVDDPRLPDSSVDLILMVDVYHEFDFPYEMAKAMVKALRPGGRIAFVEYRKENPDVPIKRVHKMTVLQVRKEMAVFPLQWVETINVLPRQHIIIFRKPLSQK